MNTAQKTHRIEINGLTRDLPVREVAPNIRVALFQLLGDAELTETAGRALADLLPKDVEVLVMPEGKALALVHVLQRLTGLPTVVARKGRKSYMLEPVLSAKAASITTQDRHDFCLDAEDVAKLAGRKVAIIDDVVSTGGTLEAMAALLVQADAAVTAVLAACTEGSEPRPDVIALVHLPLF